MICVFCCATGRVLGWAINIFEAWISFREKEIYVRSRTMTLEPSLYYQLPPAQTFHEWNESLPNVFWESLPLIIPRLTDAVVVSAALLLRAWAYHLTDYDGRLSPRARVALRRNVANHFPLAKYTRKKLLSVAVDLLLELSIFLSMAGVFLLFRFTEVA